MSCVRGCCATEADHYKSITFTSTPTREGNEKDSVLSRNLDAYYRLRQQGLHPPSIDSASELEKRASDQFEIDTGHLYKDAEEKKRVREAVEQHEMAKLGVDL